jgi:hypothetical protein
MSPCIVYRDDGTLCRAPAAILDPQRGGMVCVRHAPPVPPPEQQEEKAHVPL